MTEILGGRSRARLRLRIRIPSSQARQPELLQDGIHLRRIPEVQRGLDLAGRGALPDDRLLRALAGEEAQASEEDALARPGLARDRGEAGLEVEGDLIQQGQVADVERLEHEPGKG